MKLLTPVILSLLAASSARADGSAGVFVEGPGSGAVRDQLAAALAESHSVVSHGSFARELTKAGWKKLEERIGEGVGAAELGSIATAARAAGATIAVLGRVDGPGRTRQTMRLVVIDVAGSSVMGDERVTIAFAKKKKRRVTWRPDFGEARAALERALTRSDAGEAAAGGGTSWGDLPDWASGGKKKSSGVSLTPGAPTQRKVEEAEEEEDDDRLASSSSPLARIQGLQARPYGSAFLVAAGGFNLGGRRYSYNDPLTSNLRPYSASGAPGVNTALHFYPLALGGGEGIGSSIGVDATYSQAIGLESVVEDRPGVVISVDWRQWRIGPRVRFHLAPLHVGLTAGYGELAFIFDAPASLDFADELPEVRYRYLRAGFDFRLEATDYNIVGGFAYDHMLSSGPVGDDYFPRSNEAGIDAELGASVHIIGGVEARLIGRYTHIFYDMKPEPGDPYVAGGALDQYLGLEMGLMRAF